MCIVFVHMYIYVYNVRACVLLFLRLVNFEWAEHPLIVDFSGDMTSKDLAAIRERFSSASPVASHWRRLPFHVVASYDRQRGFAPCFGLSRPERVTLKMVQACARQTHLALQRWMAAGQTDSDGALLELFQCSAIEMKFHVVIQLSRSIVNKPTAASGLTVGQSKWSAALAGPPAFHTTLFSNLSARELSGADLCFRYRSADMAAVIRCLMSFLVCFSKKEKIPFKRTMWSSSARSTAPMRSSFGTRHQVCLQYIYIYIYIYIYSYMYTCVHTTIIYPGV